MIVRAKALPLIVIFALSTMLAVSTGPVGNVSASTSQSTVAVMIPVGAGFPTGMNGSSSPIWYSPSNITVVIGVNNTVVWTNGDTVPHTVVDNGRAFASGILNLGQSYNYTYTTTGSYPYYCTLHPWMTGIVIVKAGSQVSSVTTAMAEFPSGFTWVFAAALLILGTGSARFS